jgi:hypothetical protein
MKKKGPAEKPTLYSWFMCIPAHVATAASAVQAWAKPGATVRIFAALGFHLGRIE